MKAILRLYRDSFSGLSTPTWILSLVMLINRSGAMVIPFMSLYLIEDLGFTEKETGNILMFYGLGAVTGTLTGGFLTDKIGHYRVQLGSLVVTGLYFFIMPYLTTYQNVIIGVFMLSAIADTIRPANGASIAYYARKENITKAFSLNRLAINLGYSIGPAIGGVLAGLSYSYLFYADGVTCIIAGVVFGLYFKNLRKGEDAERKSNAETGVKGKSPYGDLPFLIFCISNTAFAIVFFQILSTLPLYYREIYEFQESSVGLMLAVNGLFIFALEMVIVHVWGEKVKMRHFLVAGAVLAGLSFVMLNFYFAIWWIVIAMIVLSFSEIFAMPFAVAFVSNRADSASRGKYMGLFTFSYATAHIIAPKMGMTLIADYGFSTLFWVLGSIAALSATGFYFSSKWMKA
ncbi:MAG: MFS transporter [Flavobacteriia bacterium]|nr:MFS transporter [Flavobacteriia bacterium]